LAPLQSWGGASGIAIAAEARPWAADHERAVSLARQGETASALLILERLRREHPENLVVARDVVTVTASAGRDAEAIALFRALPPGPQPDYVLEAIGRSYRRTGQPDPALALYRRGLQQSPENPLFAGGEIRSLADLKQFMSAQALVDADIARRGERIDVLLAAGYTASAQKKPVAALNYIDRALALDPGNREATHDRILAIAEMGAPQVAQRLADENPGVLSEAERRRIDADAAAALVRFGVFEPPDEERRFAATDQAIAALDTLIARWESAGDAAQGDLLRARFDRMVALRDRVRMADVLSEYESLRRQGVDIPGYVLVAVADAFLYFRRPEAARDLFQRGLDVDPNNPETKLALFYAYVELGDFDRVYRHVDTMTLDQPTVLYPKGLKDPVENPHRANADLAAANARLYAGELAEAHRRIDAIVEAAPNNSRYVASRANIYSARGWPRLAAEEYEISHALTPRNVSSEVGRARNELDLRKYRRVESRLADLKQRFPENLEVRRLDRLWQVHNMAELNLNAERAILADTNAQGGSGIAVGATLYSPPLAYNWRIFGSGFVAHQDLPDAEGEITLRRSGIGLEYRGSDLLASLEGTISAFEPEVDSPLGSDIGDGRAGARATAVWSDGDYWEIGADLELFARDTPLRALRSGVTADAAGLGVTYRRSESQSLELRGGAMDFSDGNLRTRLAAEGLQRLYTRPQFSIDWVPEVAGSQNSADSDRRYFNPGRDLLATVGLSITQTIYHRYELIYDHQLVVKPGLYWQEDFGTGGAASLFYEHRLHRNDALEGGLGVSFGLQPYDGNYETNLAILLDLKVRF